MIINFNSMKKYNFYTLLLFCTVGVLMLSASSNYQSLKYKQTDSKFLQDTVKQVAWLAPASADSIKNPLTVSKESISKAKCA